MALNTSSGAYEQLFDTSAPENSDTYYEGYVEMKLNFIKWSKYWCVLKKKNLHFFKDVNTQIKENYVGFFPLDGVTNIELKGNNNELHMIKKSRKITLKTQNPYLRDTWLESFKKSLKGEPPVTNNYILPGSGPVSSGPNSPVKRQPSLSPQCSPPSSPPPSSPPPSSPPPLSPSHRHSSPRKSSTGSLRYPDLPQIQTENLNDRVQQIADNAEMTAADMKIQEQLMASDKSWYKPSLRREDVSEILDKENNGVFIVRDYIEVSSSRNMGYVISLKDNTGEILHHKILKTPDGNLFIKGHEGKRFDALHNLLRFFIVSQRRTIVLVPYNPSQDDGAYSYEFMGAGFAQFDETIVGKKARSGSLPPQPVSNFFSTKARSKSLYDHSAFPPVPASPRSAGMDRVSSFKHRALPEIPSDSRCSPGNYINVDGRADSVQQRPLPTPPNAAGGTYISEGEYLNPVDQDTGRYTVRNKSIADGSDSYVDMQSPQKKLERIESGVALSPPLSPNESYEIITPPSFRSSYENIEPNVFNNNSPNLGHIVEEPAPKLPPRRSKSMRDDRAYVNLPGGGDRSPRPPLRKAHTLKR